MANYAIILAGGTGSRLGADKPKQFVEVMGKPIIAYTLDLFQENPKIEAIEIACHPDWSDEMKNVVERYGFSKVRWICDGGSTFQLSTRNAIRNLKEDLEDDDIVVISFGVSPMTPQADIDDSIRVCEAHGNGISSADMDLCTCIKDGEDSSVESILRENLKGFANPWTFRYGELLDAYDQAERLGILEDLEPHTTSLYFALGKRVWFSQYTAQQVKITRQSDIDAFEGYLLLKEKRKKEARSKGEQQGKTNRKEIGQ